MKKYFKDPFSYLAWLAIIVVGLLFGFFYSWWVPSIAWPLYVALFYFKRNSP